MNLISGVLKTPLNFSPLTKNEFKICFDRWFDSVRNYIYYRCGDSDLATDITQDAFMRLWEKDFEYHPNKTKSLIYKIAREMWISGHRKNSKFQKTELSLNYVDESTQPSQELEYNELRRTYERVLAQLPENQRDVFLMNRMEQLSYKEIAERLELSVKAIEKRMSLALAFLRKELNHE
tara:strand:+ start:535 stop:1071 length:537 start_codon:yes stop_codon:yes gene_type:complete